MSQPSPASPANDNVPRTSAQSSEKLTYAPASSLTGIESHRNVLGFFGLLDAWNKAANDNEPTPARSSQSDDASDER